MGMKEWWQGGKRDERELDRRCGGGKEQILVGGREVNWWQLERKNTEVKERVLVEEREQ